MLKLNDTQGLERDQKLHDRFKLKNSQILLIQT